MRQSLNALVFVWFTIMSFFECLVATKEPVGQFVYQIFRWGLFLWELGMGIRLMHGWLVGFGVLVLILGSVSKPVDGGMESPEGSATEQNQDQSR